MNNNERFSYLTGGFSHFNLKTDFENPPNKRFDLLLLLVRHRRNHFKANFKARDECY